MKFVQAFDLSQQVTKIGPFTLLIVKDGTVVLNSRLTRARAPTQKQYTFTFIFTPLVQAMTHDNGKLDIRKVDPL